MDVLMCARVRDVVVPPLPRGYTFHFLSLQTCHAMEWLYTEYYKTLWQPNTFHRRELYERIERKADWIAVLLRDGQGGHPEYAASALLIDLGAEKWMVEYVLVLPTLRSCGLGGQLMRYLAQAASTHKVKRLLLNCTQELRGYYEQFDYVVVP